MRMIAQCGLLFAEDFWECNCTHNFVHRKSEKPVCGRCKLPHDEMPDARVDEMLIYNPNMLTQDERLQAVRFLIALQPDKYQAYPPLTEAELSGTIL